MPEKCLQMLLWNSTTVLRTWDRKDGRHFAPQYSAGPPYSVTPCPGNTTLLTQHKLESHRFFSRCARWNGATLIASFWNWPLAPPIVCKLPGEQRERHPYNNFSHTKWSFACKKVSVRGCDVRFAGGWQYLAFFDSEGKVRFHPHASIYFVCVSRWYVPAAAASVLSAYTWNQLKPGLHTNGGPVLGRRRKMRDYV